MQRLTQVQRGRREVESNLKARPQHRVCQPLVRARGSRPGRAQRSPSTMPSPGWPAGQEQAQTFEFECPWCGEHLEISSDAPRKRRRGTYGVSPPPQIRCNCESCGKLIDVEIPPEQSRASDEQTDLEFEPASAQPLEGYENLGPDGGAWCRVRGCELANQPCKRYEGGIICFCRTHWNQISGNAHYMDILRREAAESGRPLSF